MAGVPELSLKWDAKRTLINTTHEYTPYRPPISVCNSITNGR